MEQQSKEDLEMIIDIVQRGILSTTDDKHRLWLMRSETRMQEEYLRRYGTIYESKGLYTSTN